MKITALWSRASCCLVEVKCCIYSQNQIDVSEIRTASINRVIIALMMKSVRTFETSFYFYETTRCHVPEGCSYFHKSH
jgi:hypothetical protein